MSKRRTALVIGLVLVAAACGSAAVSEPDAPDTTAAAPATAVDDGETTTTATPTTVATAEVAPSDTEAPAEAASDGATSATIPPAVSELNRDPVGGGGNPQGTLGELMSFTAAGVVGGTVDVSTYVGRDVVLWFWAPWCSWCNAEAPRVSAAAAEFEGRVEVLGIAGVAGLEDMQSFVERHGLEHITHIADHDGAIWLDFDVTYQPWWIFINDDGTVIDNWQGRLSDEEIHQRLETLAAS